ncbi:T-complex protein 1 subunit theta [Lathyrus oleraceus]|uniref:T-complex protein 1 subunit theta n=1 Tax=Pisum sativum TaxID=3888 RepID=A0A9D4X0L2_PEA|nr:T-complex protein 1 subunit theta [Pisum sativum]
MNQSGVDEIGDQWLDHYNDRPDMDMDPMEATDISVLLKRSSGNKGPIVRERTPRSKICFNSQSSYGMQSMLKECHKHLSGLDEAILKNTDACNQLFTITRTSLGPNGMNEMVTNHLDKLFMTNDTATIVNELEVQHPVAKILVLASKAQQEEIGDGANLTISFAGEFLHGVEELIRMGLHPSEIISGYTKAIKFSTEQLL